MMVAIVFMSRTLLFKSHPSGLAELSQEDSQLSWILQGSESCFKSRRYDDYGR